MFHVLEKLNSGLAKILKAIIIVIFSVMVFACFAQVITRMIEVPLSWSEELARYLAIWLTFLGASYALRENGLATVEILIDRLKGRGKKSLIVFISLVIIIFSMIFGFFGTQLVITFAAQTSPAMRLPMSIVYMTAPLNGIIMILFAIELGYKNFMAVEGSV